MKFLKECDRQKILMHFWQSKIYDKKWKKNISDRNIHHNCQMYQTNQTIYTESIFLMMEDFCPICGVWLLHGFLFREWEGLNVLLLHVHPLGCLFNQTSSFLLQCHLPYRIMAFWRGWTSCISSSYIPPHICSTKCPVLSPLNAFSILFAAYLSFAGKMPVF